MKKRPLSVTIISWIYILLSILILFGTLLRMLHPAFRQAVLQHLDSFMFTRLGPVLGIICGIFMLRGCNWARQLIFVWFAIAALSIVVFQPWDIWKPTLLFIIAVFFLYRPSAADYFRAARHESPEIPKSDDKPVA
jgi:hypothetical protein